jgi:hypothetical protein
MSRFQENSVDIKTLGSALSRRRFMAGTGSLAAAAALAGCADDGTVTLATPTSSYNDNDILNFALNLEYLEANFYSYAATGAGLSTTDQGTGAGTVSVPSTTKLTYSGANATFQQNLINELAYTEQQHVRLLRATLANNAAPMPSIDLMASFTTLAGLAGLPSTFSPFANFDSFITAAAIFEDIGVTAYNGAAPLISTAGIQAGLLSAAAGIMSVEAYHGASLRGYLFAQAALLGTTAYPYLGYFNSLQNVIKTLSSGYGTLNLQGVNTTPTTVAQASTPNVVPADANALAFHRTTDQVLHIAYGSLSNTSGSTTSSAGVAKGGFFPNGFNGNIKTTLS